MLDELIYSLKSFLLLFAVSIGFRRAAYCSDATECLSDSWTYFVRKIGCLPFILLIKISNNVPVIEIV